MRVLKWDLTLEPQQTIVIPRGSKPLVVGFQHGMLKLWTESSPFEFYVAVEIYVVPTGFAEIPPRTEYIVTAFHPDNTVWHVYKEENPND